MTISYEDNHVVPGVWECPAALREQEGNLNEYASWLGAHVQAEWSGIEFEGTVVEVDEGSFVVATTGWGEPPTSAEVELSFSTDYERARVAARFEGTEKSRNAADPSSRDLIFSLVYLNVEPIDSPRVVLPFTPGSVLFGGIPISCSLIEASEGYVDVITDFGLDATDTTELTVATCQGEAKLVGTVKFSGEEPGAGGKFKSRIECEGASRVDSIRWAHYWKQKAA